jgi:hypothetical protein
MSAGSLRFSPSLGMTPAWIANLFPDLSDPDSWLELFSALG